MPSTYFYDLVRQEESQQAEKNIEILIEQLLAQLFDMKQKLYKYEDILFDAEFLAAVPLVNQISAGMDQIAYAYLQVITASEIVKNIENIVKRLKEIQLFSNTIQILFKRLELSASSKYSDVIMLAGATFQDMQKQIQQYSEKASEILEKAKQKKRQAEKMYEEVVEQNMQSEQSEKNIDVSGTWDTNYGKLQLTQDGNIVKGIYPYQHGSVQGVLEGNVLTGIWKRESGVTKDGNTGKFELIFGKDFFVGHWGYDYSIDPQNNWYGRRSISKNN